ncbi:hypothetical protein T484DRAFT_1628740 [Baffinella frigidus]|nr:hypothetical protein T484DRAFT_1628740 [Cryptophyta sp. CCMP2293]
MCPRGGWDEWGATEVCTLHPTPYTLHPTPHTLHPTPYTLHPTPYILHPTPYTLHPTPYTLHTKPETRSTKPEALVGKLMCPRGGWKEWGAAELCTPYHLAATGGFTDTVHLNYLYSNLIHCPGTYPEFHPEFKAKRNSAADKWMVRMIGHPMPENYYTFAVGRDQMVQV